MSLIVDVLNWVLWDRQMEMYSKQLDNDSGSQNRSLDELEIGNNKCGWQIPTTHDIY